MNLRSETVYSLMSFWLKYNPSITKKELLIKLTQFENDHQKQFGQSVSFYPNLNELSKILLDNHVSDEFKEIHDFFIFSPESNTLISKIEPDLDVFSLNELSLLPKI